MTWPEQGDTKLAWVGPACAPPSPSHCHVKVLSEPPWPRSSIQPTGKCSTHRYRQCPPVHRSCVNSHLVARCSPADGPRKQVESLQKRIDFYIEETCRLRSAQNSHASISRLHAEVLGEVFLHVVESGIEDNAHFVTKTFGFRQVCKHWNEVAVSSPRLWCWWVPGSWRAWTLFNAHSKNTPLSLTWRPQLSTSARDTLMNCGVSKRIHQLDFSGNGGQLAEFLGTFDSSPPSNVSSLRFQITPYNIPEPREPLDRFLSSPFPKLSQLDLENFLPNTSSSIFTTTNLTSLGVSIPSENENRYTLSQFSQILQQHLNIQELNLDRGGLPLPGKSDPLVPVILPRLVTLRLHGSEAAISGFINLIGMSSPLRNVTMSFARDPNLIVPALAGAVRKILVAYHECQGSDYHRKIHRFTVAYNREKERLVFTARPRSASTPNLKSNFRFQFNGIDENVGDAMVKETFPLFPLNDVREFAAKGPAIYGDRYGEMFQKMKDLSHLRLDRQCIPPALQALYSGNWSLSRVITKTTSTYPRAQMNRINKPSRSWSR